ncbi:MAG: IS1595 family transposase [Bacteroidia bacterium]|nr:IS1595 family transposase [Bacteroidia bacterium]
MAKSKIQFQEGLSLPRFLATYGTGEQCRQALFKMRWPRGFQCPKCGHGQNLNVFFKRYPCQLDQKSCLSVFVIAK